MAEEYQLSFTLPQVKALIRALEECGVGAGSPRTEIEHFRSTQLVTAANAAYEALKAKRQRIKREHNTCPLMLALFKRPARLWRVGRFFLLVSLLKQPAARCCGGGRRRIEQFRDTNVDLPGGLSIDHNRLCRDDSKCNVRYFDSERLLWKDPTDRSGWSTADGQPNCLSSGQKPPLIGSR